MTRQIVRPGQLVRILDREQELPGVYEVLSQVRKTPPELIQLSYEFHVSPDPEDHLDSADPRRAAWAKSMVDTPVVGWTPAGQHGNQWWLLPTDPDAPQEFVRAMAESLRVVGSVLKNAGLENRVEITTYTDPTGQRPMTESWKVEAQNDQEEILVRRQGRIYLVHRSRLDSGNFEAEAKAGANVFKSLKKAKAALNRRIE